MNKNKKKKEETKKRPNKNIRRKGLWEKKGPTSCKIAGKWSFLPLTPKKETKPPKTKPTPHRPETKKQPPPPKRTQTTDKNKPVIKYAFLNLQKSSKTPQKTRENTIK